MASNSQPSESKAPKNYNAITKYGSWIVIAVALTGAAQFDSTAQLSATFAYLILVATILYYGIDALNNVNGLVGGKKVAADEVFNKVSS